MGGFAGAVPQAEYLFLIRHAGYGHQHMYESLYEVNYVPRHFGT